MPPECSRCCSTARPTIIEITHLCIYTLVLLPPPCCWPSTITVALPKSTYVFSAEMKTSGISIAKITPETNFLTVARVICPAGSATMPSLARALRLLRSARLRRAGSAEGSAHNDSNLVRRRPAAGQCAPHRSYGSYSEELTRRCRCCHILLDRVQEISFGGLAGAIWRRGAAVSLVPEPGRDPPRQQEPR
jgi:hypothetical protein